MSRRVSASSIIGRRGRRRIVDHNCQKGTIFPSLINHPSSFLFLLFRSLSTTRSPSSPPVRCNDLQDAVNSFNGMIQMRPLPPISQCTKALRPILKMGHYDIALRLIGKLHFLGIQVDIYTFSIVINCYCRLNQVDFGFSLLGTLFKRGYTPNVTTFKTLLNGLILDDKTPEAVELFKKLMRTREIEPGVVMYGTIVNGLCRTGNTIRAVSLLRIMEKGSCKPDTVVYNTIIDSLCKDRMVDDATKLFSKMDEKGIFPDVVTYTSLIHGLCNFGQRKEATEMLREMLDSGIAPNVLTYSVLLDACTKEGKMKEAEGVLEVMIQRGVDPNVVTYSTLMDGYCMQGHMDKAIRVFNTMVERGLHPNAFSYTILIDGYCKKMKIDEAMLLFRELPRRGLKPNNGTFNAMLWGLFQTGRRGAAQKLFNDMQAAGINPDSTIDPHLPSAGRMPRSPSVLRPRCQASQTSYSSAQATHQPSVAPSDPRQTHPGLPRLAPLPRPDILIKSRGVTRVLARNSIDQVLFQQDSQKPKDPINILEIKPHTQIDT
ncbi:hypothetical protein HYC85_021901 [Camellia sinensis]|uniref:Pentacotripeptide-repeat region of PRORP domain-containing protein n=1 Tax=Camellia sinensis TaxID=4442 RepID=A0A7J7GMT0_CAMSI|nr:hypothetical protein HYC85_021901 [Camellia sinensis]